MRKKAPPFSKKPIPYQKKKPECIPQSESKGGMAVVGQVTASSGVHPTQLSSLKKRPFVYLCSAD